MGRVDDLGELFPLDLRRAANTKKHKTPSALIRPTPATPPTHDLLPNPHPNLLMKLIRPPRYISSDNLGQSRPKRPRTDDGDLVFTRGETGFGEFRGDGG